MDSIPATSPPIVFTIKWNIFFVWVFSDSYDVKRKQNGKSVSLTCYTETLPVEDIYDGMLFLNIITNITYLFSLQKCIRDNSTIN